MQQAQTGSFEVFDASSYRVGIVVSQFNKGITDELLDSALDILKKYNVTTENILVTKVAGAIELPLVLQAMAKIKHYDCLVALGCVIRGETPHFEYVCKLVSEGILRVQLDFSIPIGFGILTCENQTQAEERTHLGGGYAEAALQSAKTISELK